MGRGKRRESREKRDWIPSRNPNSRPQLIKFRKSCLGVLPIKLFDLFLSRTSLNSVIRSCLFHFSSYYFFKWGSRKNEIHFITLIRSRAVVLLSSERRAAREKVKLCTPLTRAFDLQSSVLSRFFRCGSSACWKGFDPRGVLLRNLVGDSAARFSDRPNIRKRIRR